MSYDRNRVYEGENKEKQLPRCHDLGTHAVNCFDNNCRECLCGPTDEPETETEAIPAP